MSNIDLTAAFEAGAAGWWEKLHRLLPESHVSHGLAWDDLPSNRQRDLRDEAISAITPAVPLIEAQVREQIAAEIEAERDRLYPGDLMASRIIRAVLTDVADLVRGVTS
jgi:hypothetical protein